MWNRYTGNEERASTGFNVQWLPKCYNYDDNQRPWFFCE